MVGEPNRPLQRTALATRAVRAPTPPTQHSIVPRRTFGATTAAAERRTLDAPTGQCP